MLMIDTTPLQASARRLDDLADVLRTRARHLGRHAESLRWQSPAARLFLGHLDEVTVRLGGCATRLDDLANALRARALVLARLP